MIRADAKHTAAANVRQSLSRTAQSIDSPSAHKRPKLLVRMNDSRRLQTRRVYLIISCAELISRSFYPVVNTTAMTGVHLFMPAVSQFMTTLSET